MNNSLLATQDIDLNVETPLDTTPILREKVVKLEKIIEAFDKISESNYWKVLDEEIFSGVLEALNRRMRNEKDQTELFRLQGQLMWASKFCDLKSLAETYKKELINISNKLNA